MIALALLIPLAASLVTAAIQTSDQVLRSEQYKRLYFYHPPDSTEPGTLQYLPLPEDGSLRGLSANRLPTYPLPTPPGSYNETNHLFIGPASPDSQGETENIYIICGTHGSIHRLNPGMPTWEEVYTVGLPQEKPDSANDKSRYEVKVLPPGSAAASLHGGLYVHGGLRYLRSKQPSGPTEAIVIGETAVFSVHTHSDGQLRGAARWEKRDADAPRPRAGHSLTPISDRSAVVLGGHAGLLGAEVA